MFTPLAWPVLLEHRLNSHSSELAVRKDGNSTDGAVQVGVQATHLDNKSSLGLYAAWEQVS